MIVAARAAFLSGLAILMAKGGLAQDYGAFDLPKVFERGGVTAEAGGDRTESAIERLRLVSGEVTLDLAALAFDGGTDGRPAGRAGAGVAAWPDPDDPESGRIRFRDLETDDLRVVPLLLAGRWCAEASAASVPARLEMKNLTFVATRRMLPPGSAPEEMSARGARLSLRLDRQGTCFRPEALELDGVRIRAFDTSSLFADRAEISLREADGAGVFLTEVRSLAALHPDQTDILTLGTLRLRLVLPRDPSGTIEQIRTGGLAAAMMELFGREDPQLEAVFRDLDLPLGRFLPESDRRMLGIAPEARVAGGAQMRIASPGRTLSVEGDGDLRGLLRFRISADLGLGAESAPVAVAPSGLGLLAPALPAELRSARLDLQDDGLAAMVAAATGSSPGSLADDLVRDLPEPFRAPIADWVRDIAEGREVLVELRPAEPVSLLRAAFAASFDLDALGELLGFHRTVTQM
ncbi:hypothetical protein LAZ40_11590 [Cereibacter sphaeroides]|uniref:hypothetical protein n=1 Tax=Cereibacter sphaeroides TaxID=1063 RepID=UPI001F40AF21|nr:hypothetical protein [Cereibacter sphaeroides]MCE6959661.1 hypothetical protein [Cereibacter sphaeroides]MCE6974478.1 hypothetical protein [Cereibacter sphaeroides]